MQDRRRTGGVRLRIDSRFSSRTTASISYDLVSRKVRPLQRQARPKHAAPDWVGRLATRGRSHNAARGAWMDFSPVQGATGPNVPDGVRFACSRGQARSSNGCRPAGRSWCPRSRKRFRWLLAGNSMPLPIALELLDFEVQRNEGSDSPAGFKSTCPRDRSRRRHGHRAMLDEQSLQLSRRNGGGPGPG